MKESYKNTLSGYLKSLVENVTKPDYWVVSQKDYWVVYRDYVAVCAHRDYEKACRVADRLGANHVQHVHGRA
jgi:hypothetical protein